MQTIIYCVIFVDYFLERPLKAVDFSRLFIRTSA